MAALQLKAVALALKGFPDLNGLWREGAYEPSEAVHLGVAISHPPGRARRAGDPRLPRP